MGRAEHRIFFAVRLAGGAADDAFALAGQVRTEHGLRGRLIPTDRLHVTLHWLQDHAVFPDELVTQAGLAGRRVEIERFDVTFNRIESMGDETHGGPLVLRGSDGLAALRRLQRALGAAMIDAGLGQYVRSSFKPHVTLLYDDGFVAPQAVDPIGWTVTEFVLVHSIIGKSKHLELGRWALQSKQFGFDGW